MRRGANRLGSNPSSFEIGYALGNAYGDMWANNARKRQEKKLDDYIAQQENPDYMASINAAQPVATDGNMDRALSVLRQGNDYNLYNDYSLSPLVGEERKSGVDKAIDAIVKADSQGVINFMRGQEGMTPLERAKQKYSNLNVDDVTAWAKKQGINQEVIDSRIPALQKELATNVGGLMAQEINNNLYSGDMNKIIAGIQQLDELAKYDPARAEQMRNFGNQQYARAQNLNDRKTLGQGKTQYRISDIVYNNALKANQDLVMQGVPLTNEQKAVYDTNARIIAIGSAERGIGSNVNENVVGSAIGLPQIDPTNWESIKAAIDISRNTKGKGDKIPTLEQIYDNLKEEGLSDEMLLKAKNYMGYKTPEEIEAEKARREKETKDTLNWGGRGGTNTVETPLFETWGQRASNKPILNKKLL